MNIDYIYVNIRNKQFDIIYKANRNDIDYFENDMKNRFVLSGEKDNEVSVLHLENELQNIASKDNIISFDTYTYIAELINSYKKSTNIIHQFNIDYDRQNIYLNGYKYNIDNFKYYLKQIISKFHFNNFKILTLSCEMFILLLCCQSSFAYPYQLLVNLYKLDGNNDSDRRTSNCFLTSNKKKSNIKITINEQFINIELITYLQIKNIETMIVNGNIAVTLIFVINKSEESIPNYIPSSIFTWNNVI